MLCWPFSLVVAGLLEPIDDLLLVSDGWAWPQLAELGMFMALTWRPKFDVYVLRFVV